MKDIILALCALVFILSVCGGSIVYTDNRTCQNKYSSFENKYDFWSQCQIKLDGKWIPADSYYFMEE